MGMENRIDLTPGIPTDERLGAAAIVPGNILVLGSANTLTLHGAAARTDAIRVACTAPERGKGITDSYASGETVRFCRPAHGQKVNVVLADSETIAIGAILYAAAVGQVSGTLVAGARLGIAEEAVTTSGATALISMTVSDAGA